MKRYLFFFFIAVQLAACKENDNIRSYDPDASYVYFAYPNPAYNPTERFLDSINYNFALDEDLTLTEKTIAVPVRIGGNSRDQNREYVFRVAGESNYSPELITLSTPVIEADSYSGTLYVTIKRGAELLEEQQELILTLEPNEYFQVGHQYNGTLKIAFSDILTEPSWWNAWRTYFGPFYKEVFQQWIQIYYLGADPSPHLTDGTPGPVYYWNNMPSSSFVTWYPVTHMYIGVLKRYFEEHVVYPNGDTTQERILLP